MTLPPLPGHSEVEQQQRRLAWAYFERNISGKRQDLRKAAMDKIYEVYGRRRPIEKEKR
jgi:hypothetical protein